MGDIVLGKRCRDKITKTEGICTAKLITMFGSVEYCLENDNPLKSYEPKWIEADRVEVMREEAFLIADDLMPDKEENQTGSYNKESMEAKRGQIFRNDVR